MPLILASNSRHRAKLLTDVGLEFSGHHPQIDERAIDQTLGQDVSPEDRAQILAQAKALAVSEEFPSALVLGCDQILALGDEIIHKAVDFEAARATLLKLSGQTHTLYSALALAKNGEIIWSFTAPVHMTMRKLNPENIGRYLALTQESILSSVGCYQIEGPGLQLFEKIDGDYWSIIGLPLLPLLAELRARGEING
ncbi:MAG: Maf family nucleotide pyrophosphatase [Notoacmeibacter sp.]